MYISAIIKVPHNPVVLNSTLNWFKMVLLSSGIHFSVAKCLSDWHSATKNVQIRACSDKISTTWPMVQRLHLSIYLYLLCVKESVIELYHFLSCRSSCLHVPPVKLPWLSLGKYSERGCTAESWELSLSHSLLVLCNLSLVTSVVFGLSSLWVIQTCAVLKIAFETFNTFFWECLWYSLVIDVRMKPYVLITLVAAVYIFRVRFTRRQR